MLTVHALEAHYGGNQALKGVSLDVACGEIVCLIGANGAGKSTLLNCLSGIHPKSSGSVLFLGKNITAADSQSIVAMGIVQAPEGRRLFGPMSVIENLEMGAYLRRLTPMGVRREIFKIFDTFPALEEKGLQRAGSLSGGEQQMVALGRALMADPKLLLLDEPSLGLAPLIVREIFRVIEEIRRSGRTVLLVEQNALGALGLSQRGYVMETGHITLNGPSKALIQDKRVQKAFLGQ